MRVKHSIFFIHLSLKRCLTACIYVGVYSNIIIVITVYCHCDTSTKYSIVFKICVPPALGYNYIKCDLIGCWHTAIFNVNFPSLASCVDFSMCMCVCLSDPQAINYY